MVQIYVVARAFLFEKISPFVRIDRMGLQIVDMWFKKDQHIGRQQKDSLVIDLLVTIESPRKSMVRQA